MTLFEFSDKLRSFLLTPSPIFLLTVTVSLISDLDRPTLNDRADLLQNVRINNLLPKLRIICQELAPTSARTGAAAACA